MPIKRANAEQGDGPQPQHRPPKRRPTACRGPDRGPPTRGTFVRECGEVEVVDVSEGCVSARMPTPEERRRLTMDEGAPVLEIVERDQIYPADRTMLKVTP